MTVVPRRLWEWEVMPQVDRISLFPRELAFGNEKGS